VFIHCVLFKIKNKDVPTYKRDCRIWEREAKKHPGFLGYRTLERTNERGQYASFYTWRNEQHHHRFMKKHHDRLVGLSKCPVEVLGYYNFKTI
jgi:heme-degrading monooxygenase HmoA